MDISIAHPVPMIAFLVLTCISFGLFGFIIGIVRRASSSFNSCRFSSLPPLVFLGGSFYSISMLPPTWQTISLFNPVLYLVSGFRWSFYGMSDVPIAASLAAITLFTVLCLGVIWWIFRTGYRLKT